MMMMNLFSNFDPISSIILFPLNWLSMNLSFFFLPLILWNSSSRYIFSKFFFYFYIFNEFKNLINEKKNSYIPLLLTSIFMLIFINNFMSLYPFIFTPTSHLSLTMSFALPIWLCFILFSLINLFKSMCAHLLPLNTPSILMPFMIIIESISLLIRPITLSIRLSANLISGHLLLTLLGMASSINILSSPFMTFTQMILLLLEISVSLIQAYVFSMLISLYYKETLMN
uniref:ATP synthase subunit a n=1 Tax=Tremex columba TaxID=222809 RepID=A0A3G5BC62_TRECO|nr:ATP synthase F0 subunit 6 [Tremex columba]AYV97234.1 ATP synthase F0 subunit 6 [Tremex columba]